MLFLISSFAGAQTNDEVREPAVAGMFYPRNAKKLTAMIDEYLAPTEKVITGEIGGLVAPHAGYIYSGPVAAWSYEQISGNSYDVVVILAPSHYENFQGVSIFPGKYYETPLGKIAVDQDLAIRVSQASPDIHLSEQGHHPGYSGRGEHSLEVQLPFLQKVLGYFEIIPIIMADQSWENDKMLGDALAETLKDKNALIVASSDLSHYHSYSEARELDKLLIGLFNSFDYEKIVRECESRKVEACGYGPIVTMMYACARLGYKKSKVVNYATSGDVPAGEKSQVVGYLGGVVYK